MRRGYVYVYESPIGIYTCVCVGVCAYVCARVCVCVCVCVGPAALVACMLCGSLQHVFHTVKHVNANPHKHDTYMHLPEMWIHTHVIQ